ncbi:PAS-domain containing protein [Roseiarcus fermentans]|nr:PAS-domain containing protein [Roseiarcus fermentans]
MVLVSDSLRQFVAQSPKAMAMFDREMRYLAASARWLAFMGLERTPVGRGHYEDYPDGGGIWKGAHRRCLAGAIETSEGERFVRPDGRVRWLSYEICPWRDGDGAIGGLVISGDDVTARIEAEQRAEDLTRRLEEALRRAEEAERRLGDAIEIIPGGFLLYNSDDRLVVCNQATREMYPALADVLRPGAPFDRILRAGLDRGHGPVEPGQEEAWVRARTERRRNPSGAIEQLTVAGRWIRIEERRTSDGGLVALRTDITDLKTRENALAEKTALLETVLENMGEGIAVFDRNLKLMMWNDAAAQLLDAPELARLGTDFEDVVRLRVAHGDFGDVGAEARVRDAVAQFRAGRPWIRTERRPNGRLIEVRFHPLPDGGAVYVLRDVTEQAEAESKLAEKTALLEATLQNMGEGIAAFDADRRLLLVNDFAVRMGKIPPEIARPGAAYDDVLRFLSGTDETGSGDVESFVAPRIAQFLAQKPFVGARRLNDGRVMETRFTPTPAGGGIYMYRDVTERAAFEAQLAQKSALLEAALENMGEGFSVYGPDLRLVIRSKICIDMLELPPALLQPDTSFEEVMRFRAQRGDFGEGDVESLVAFRIARFRAQEPWSETRRDRNGRAIELRFNPTPEGGGVFIFHDITKRADAEAKLAQRTALLETTLENTGDGIAVFGPNLELLTYNRVIAEMLDLRAAMSSGVSLAEIIRLRAKRGDFGDVDPDASVRERIGRFRARARWSERVVLAGRVVDVHFNPMPDGGGVYVMRDVTERADAEAKLAERTALLEATLENMGEGISVYGPDLRLRTFNAAAATMFDAPAELGRPGTPFADIVRFQALRGDLGNVDAEAAVLDRIAQFRRRKPWTRTRRTPNGRVFETRFNPTPDGGGIYIFRDVTERAEQDAKLAEKTALLETVLENIGEAIAVYGPDLRLRMCNAVMADMLGAPPGLLTPGGSREDLVRFCAARGDYGDKDVEEAVRERLARFRAQEPRSAMRTMHDGRRVEAYFRPMPDRGGLFVLHDVTERERNEARIREEEAKFRSLVEQDVAGIVIVRDDGTIGYCNGCFAGMIGYARDELVGRPLLDIVPEGERPVVMRHLRGQFETGAVAQIASTLRARDGGVIEILVNASRSTVEGRLASIAIVLDVTARNTAQRALASAAAILAAVHESSPDGILVVDPAARILSVNKRFGEIMDLPAELLAPGRDGPALAMAAQRMLDGEAFLRGVRHDSEHPAELVHDELTLRDGRVLDRISSPLETADGEFLGRILFLRDISQRRRAEASLRASEERFRMLIEEAPDAILLIDFDNDRLVAANKAAERLFGVSREVILERGAQHFHAAHRPDAPPLAQSLAEHNERALAGEEVNYERRIRRPSGEERLTRVTLVRLQSNVRLLRASYVDVTDQRAAEAKLSEVLRSVVDRQEEERQRIARELHDSLGQYLAAVNIKLETFNQGLAVGSPLRAGVADLKGLTGAIGNEVSRLAWEMRPTALDDIGLEAAIQQFLDEWARRSGMRFDVHLALKGRRLPGNVETALYRVLQEGITNIVKHAHAGNVGVVLKASANDVVMIVEDNGVGFDPETLTRASSRLGLLGMRERLAAIHGGLEIETRPGEGTALIIRVTLDASTDTRR